MARVRLCGIHQIEYNREVSKEEPAPPSKCQACQWDRLVHENRKARRLGFVPGNKPRTRIWGAFKYIGHQMRRQTAHYFHFLAHAIDKDVEENTW